MLISGTKSLIGQKMCGRPTGDKDSKKYKIQRTASMYKRTVVWIEGAGLVTPQYLVSCAIISHIKQLGRETTVRSGAVGGESSPCRAGLGRDNGELGRGIKGSRHVGKRCSELSMSYREFCNNNTYIVWRSVSGSSFFSKY